jgi:hypothetical protein
MSSGHPTRRCFLPAFRPRMAIYGMRFLIIILIQPLLGHFSIDIAHGRFGSGIHMQFLEHPFQMCADGFVTHFKISGDKFVGIALGNELQDLFFTR